MVEIDFNRLVNSAKNELDYVKTVFMSDEKANEHYQKIREDAELKFYNEGGRYNSNRQLYMAKMISTPLIKNNLMKFMQDTSEMGNGYQPDVNTSLLFIPEYNDHISVYYKGYQLFDFEMKDVDGNTHEPSNIKSISIVNKEAKDILARIPNEEWNSVIDKVIPEIISDSTLDLQDVMMNKTDTPYLQKFYLYLESKSGSKSIDEILGYDEKPSSNDIVNSVSDEDLQRMYDAMLGAEAVQLGTRFLVAKESTAHDNFKQAVIKAKDIDTVITGQITGHPVRVLRNKLTKIYLQAEKEETSKENPDFERLEAIGKGTLRRIVVEGDTQMGSMMAGQIAGLIQKEETCKEIIEELMRDSRKTIQEQMKRFEG